MMAEAPPWLLWTAGLASMTVPAGLLLAHHVISDRRDHRRWLDEVERRDGPGARAVAEAEFVAGRWGRRPRRWIRRWVP